ncbi:hypothetical protein H4R19_000857 [Coemansia spiralis]|nr:hypothetical protein H4R19_000857 [Coemansia spiralis]
MEVDISPITLDTTKRLAQLYPSVAGFPGGADPAEAGLDEAGPVAVLDGFFAADFLPARGSGGQQSQQQQQQQRAKAATMPEVAQAAAASESYGAKYVRYLGEVAREHGRKQLSDGVSAASCYADEISSELARRRVWEPRARERLLVLSILVQAHIERTPELGAQLAQRLADAFAKSWLRLALWQCVAQHLAPATGSAPPVVSPDDLEVAVELLYLFAAWARSASAVRPLNELAVERVRLAVELFVRYAHQPLRRRQYHHQYHHHHTRHPVLAGGNDIGRLQRLRLGHKALLLLGATWTLVVGNEAAALRRINGAGNGSSGEPVRGLQNSVLARDALRQIFQAVDKHPLLAPDVQADVRRLLPLVHPFDGHLTRAVQLERFGPIRTAAARSPSPVPPVPLPREMGSPSTQMLLADMEARQEPAPQPSAKQRRVLAQLVGGQQSDGAQAGTLPEANLWAARKPPRAAREAVAAYVDAVCVSRSDREYAEWWRRLVAERGMPLSLTLNGPADRRGSNSDIAINYGAEVSGSGGGGGGRRGAAYEFCGIVEPEDLPGLEMALDGCEMAWPTHTAPEPDGGAYRALYRALFPLLPELSRALVLTIANWAPAEHELPVRQFLMNVGPPQPSDATCLGIVKYPRPPDHATAATPATGDAEPAVEPPPTSPLLGSNVKRLARAQSRSTGSVGTGTGQAEAALRGSASMTDAAAATGASTGVPAEVGVRLLVQHAQWQAVGALLMQMLLGLQANHVLQADYFAQLLMNENVIPAMFWWLGTASLDLCTALPAAVHAHGFSAAFERLGLGLGAATEPPPYQPALHGLRDCLRALRRLTSHNGLRKGLLYKNKAPYFYGRILRVRCAPVQQIAAELLRDVMPVASRRQKLTMLDMAAQVYLRAPAGLSDAFWLADYALDPQIEMHRHVELLRVLHFYHHCALGLRLPRDPALFPSLVAHAVDPPDPLPLPRAPTAASSAPSSARRRSVEQKAARKHTTAPSGEHSWLLWESDLEDTLNDVMARPIGAGSSG